MNHYKDVNGTPTLITRSEIMANKPIYITPTGERAMISMFEEGKSTRARKLELGVWEGDRVDVGDAPGTDAITTGPVLAFDTDRVMETYTTVALTAQEILDRDAANKAAQADGIIDGDTGKMLLSLYRTMYTIAKLSVPTLTPAQFKTQVDNATAATDIPAAGFKTWVEEQI